MYWKYLLFQFRSSFVIFFTLYVEIPFKNSSKLSDLCTLIEKIRIRLLRVVLRISLGDKSPFYVKVKKFKSYCTFCHNWIGFLLPRCARKLMIICMPREKKQKVIYNIYLSDRVSFRAFHFRNITYNSIIWSKKLTIKIHFRFRSSPNSPSIINSFVADSFKHL